MHATKIASIIGDREGACSIENVLRLTVLRDSHQEHSRTWVVSRKVEPVMPEEDWLRAMWLKPGCAHISSDILYASCGERLLDKSMYHALCCP